MKDTIDNVVNECKVWSLTKEEDEILREKELTAIKMELKRKIIEIIENEKEKTNNNH